MSRFEFAAETRSSRAGTRLFVRSAFAVTIVCALAACSAMPDSVKPDAVYGEAKPAPTPEGTKGFPDLANVPDQRPKVTSSSDQKAIVRSLEKDRAAAKEGDEDLREGGVLPPPAKGSEVKAPSESMMQPDSTDMAPAVAAAPAKAEAPAPVAKAMPAPAPAPAKVATETAPVKSAEPAPVAAPAAAPAAPAPAPAPAPVSKSAETALPPPAMEEPVSEAKAPVAAAPAQQAAEEAAEPAKPALQLPPGVIPMPPRGGHASFDDILTPEQKAARKKEAAEEVKNAAEEAAQENESEGVKAAPTTPVEVQPVPDAK